MSLVFVGLSRKNITYASSHTHRNYEVILNMEGSGRILIGSQALSFGPGTIHIIPPDTPHIKTSDTGFQDIYFQTTVLYPNTKQAQSKDPLCLQDDPGKTVETMLQLLFSRYCTKPKNDSVLQSMYELILQLLEDLCERELYPPEVEEIIHKLTISLNDPDISVNEILQQTGYSKDHIRRLFISATHMTPQKYLTDLRITYAKKLLKQSSHNHLSVADIGAMCGYYDAKYFSRVFKAETGFSPTEYICTSAQKKQAPGL